jgi:hypothetical protein
VLAEEAKRRAAQIIDQARAESEDVKAGADQYSHDTLNILITELERVLNQARNGLMVLEQKRQPARPSKPE